MHRRRRLAFLLPPVFGLAAFHKKPVPRTKRSPQLPFAVFVTARPFLVLFPKEGRGSRSGFAVVDRSEEE
jgi:hypothetical protein